MQVRGDCGADIPLLDLPSICALFECLLLILTWSYIILIQDAISPLLPKGVVAG